MSSPEIEQQPKFVIETARTRQDNIGIGEAHLQSWIETYQNQNLGIDEAWIRKEFSFLVEDRGIDFRAKQIEIANRSESEILYRVVKDSDDKVQGFLHVSRRDDGVHLDAIYLTKKAQGKGVARELMNQAIEFAGGHSISLQVVAYNDHAISFYEKYGFDKGEIDKGLFHGRMPVLNMHRDGEI